MLTEPVSVNQLTHVIYQATAPAFLLGAVAAFISILITRLNRVIDRARMLHAISTEDVLRSPLRAEIPRQERRARLLTLAVFFAILSAITVTCLILLAFIGALISLPHEKYVGILFIVACTLFCFSLAVFGLEVSLSLPSLEFHD
jgi:quinol-cytochrome oxidoreductase complex cytochrome b subunit